MSASGAPSGTASSWPLASPCTRSTSTPRGRLRANRPPHDNPWLRDVFREAAIGSAAAVVVFHNHPSGDPTPSPDDLELTRRLVAAGFVMGIEVVDHIILGDVRYWSMKKAGQL